LRRQDAHPLSRFRQELLGVVELSAVGGAHTVGGEPRNLAAFSQSQIAGSGQAFQAPHDRLCDLADR
jgi:hypothetical protein